LFVVDGRNVTACASYDKIGRNMHMEPDTCDGGANEDPRMSIASVILLERELDTSSKASGDDANRGIQRLEVVLSTIWVVRKVFSII
jgi:hypothetical protein